MAYPVHTHFHLFLSHPKWIKSALVDIFHHHKVSEIVLRVQYGFVWTLISPPKCNRSLVWNTISYPILCSYMIIKSRHSLRLTLEHAQKWMICTFFHSDKCVCVDCNSIIVVPNTRNILEQASSSLRWEWKMVSLSGEGRSRKAQGKSVSDALWATHSTFLDTHCKNWKHGKTAISTHHSLKALVG